MGAYPVCFQLEPVLLKNKAEVRRMSIFEYDEEAVRRVLKEEAYGEGEIMGRREDILDLLEDISPVPEYLRKEIMEQEDAEILKKWLKVAAKAESIEMFSMRIRQRTVHKTGCPLFLCARVWRGRMQHKLPAPCGE